MSAILDPRISWSSETFERIATLVQERAGLIFSRPRRPVIEAAIRRQATAAGFGRVNAYADVLARDAGAVDVLAAALTVGETYFFRDSAQFELLRSEIIPGILARRGGLIDVWSAGCASGEEPYSLAIACVEAGASRPRIVGTDLSSDRLHDAQQARYGKWSLRGVSEDIIHTYFRRRDTRYDLLPSIRDLVEFRRLNLADAGQRGAVAPSGVDLILCRNVLIYFDAATTARVMQALVTALAPNGWLLLGASDPPVTEYVPCDVVVTRAGLAYRPLGTVRAGTAPPPPVQPCPEPIRMDKDAFGAVRNQEDAFGSIQMDSDHSDHSEQSDGSESLEALLARVVEAHACDRNEEAAQLAERYTASGGVELVAWLIRVRALANAGLLAEAARACAAALDIHPLSAELTYLLSVLLAQAGRFADAADAARRAVYLDPTLSVAHLALGDALARMDRTADAARAFRSAQRMLERLDADAIVPASGGERSTRLRAATAARLALLEVA